jgi:serine/threonine protein kinase
MSVCQFHNKKNIFYLSDIDIEMTIYFSGSWHSSRQVAIKIQKREAVTTSAFLDESQILKQLQHQNVINLLAVSSETEPIYLLTDYMPNGRLSMYLREGKGKDLSVNTLLWIAAQVNIIF